MAETNEQLISYAVDACTVVLEDETEESIVRFACESAREILLIALIDVRTEATWPLLTR